jgi:plasmid stabilization system protein ParE
MKRSIGFDPKAKKDLQTAYDYYEAQQVGLGEDFLIEIDESLGLLLSYPFAFPNKYKNLREYAVPRFPFLIYYEVTDTQLRILSIFHTSRNK